MNEYRLTKRGKFVLALFILSLVVIIIYSGSYIIKYFVKNESFAVINETTSSDESIELPNTTSNQDSTDTSGQLNETTDTSDLPNTTEGISEGNVEITTEETSEKNVDQIYSVSDLEDLKLFKIIFYFNENDKEISFDQNDLDSIKAMLVRYKDEKLAIVGYTNGYPKFESNEKDYALSLERANYIRNSILEMGIEKKLINVYNYGSESPLYLDFGNQNKNNRVEVYFEDHYVLGNKTK